MSTSTKEPDTTTTAPKATRELSAEHKEALAQGRREGQIVTRYLDLLEARQPRRGRKPNKERMEARLQEIVAAIPAASFSERLKLIAERHELEEGLKRLSDDNSEDLAKAEAEFIEVIGSFAHRKGYDYNMLREAGVPAEVLRRGGMSPAKGGGKATVAA